MNELTDFVDPGDANPDWVDGLNRTIEWYKKFGSRNWGEIGTFLSAHPRRGAEKSGSTI